MYKIIQNNKVIDIVQNPHFVRFLVSGHIAFTDKSSANGIVGSDKATIYSFQPHPKYQTATIEKITSKEFERLQGLLNSGKEVCADESALAEAKQSKINQLSDQCKAFINAGFSIVLSDGNSYDFELTTEDQLNLMSIEGLLKSGAETIIYHASNLPCRVFLRTDMLKVIKAFRRHVTYHTTYFNVAKQYINSLTDMEKINKFSYGTDVSVAINDIIIKQILRNGADLI